MIRRGDVYFADMDPERGREQAGRRPVVVVSADFLNARDLVVTVVLGTTARPGSAAYDTNVLVPGAECGLPHDTVFLCFQVRSVDPVRFFDPKWNSARRMGRLPAHRMAEIDGALRLALSI
jgi:mRNA interferase MazF